jgi:BirA family biotin operon repressor/biotin-[acetyl-CoA-carboxylase] ligase
MPPTILNILSKQDITAHLHTRFFGQGLIEIHDRIDSTNRRAMDLGHAGASEGTVVLAENQTAGRGRYGRVWHSPPNANLYISVILRPDFGSPVPPLITLAAGLGAARGLSVVTGLNVGVKWPNDLILNKRKLAGILAELEPAGPHAPFVVLGIGVNVNIDKNQWPEDLAEKVISLKTALGREVDRSSALAALLNELENEYLELKQGQTAALLDRYRQACVTLNTEVTVSIADKKITGLAVDIDNQGRLMVRQSNGDVIHLDAGEVTLSVPKKSFQN